MTVAEARAALVERIETRVAVEVAAFKAAYLVLARDNVTAAIDDLIEAAKREVVAAEQAGLAEVASLTSDPKAGGHA